MKTLKTLLFVLTVGLLTVGCGKDDDSCSQSDWVGTYNLVGEPFECQIDEDTSIEFSDDPFVVEKGSTDTTLSIDGDELTFNECSANILGLNLSLDGNKLTISYEGCEAVYEK